MRVYADTSWWIACKYTNDLHYPEALSFLDKHPSVEILWTPWQRVEVFNSVRQLEYRGFLDSGRSERIIRLLEQEIRLGYWPHVEFSWTNAIRMAVTLAKQHGRKFAIRGMDLFHVSIARVLRVEAFLTFDVQQGAFARAAGLKVPVLV